MTSNEQKNTRSCAKRTHRNICTCNILVYIRDYSFLMHKQTIYEGRVLLGLHDWTDIIVMNVVICNMNITRVVSIVLACLRYARVSLMQRE